MLNLVRHAPGTAVRRTPLLIAHGLFGSARNWGAIARRMAADRVVLTPDMRNHGASGWQATHGYVDLAQDLADTIGAEGPMDVAGHSMGGKAAMMLALSEPAKVRRLVVLDIAPVCYPHDQAVHVATMRALDLDGLESRSQADARLARSLPDPALRAFFLQSLDLASKPPRWRLNLDVLEAEMPRIVGWPDVSGRFGGDALFLRGADSPYVRPEYQAGILALFPAARFETIAGAGHWLHAERPREVEAAIRAFLDG